MKLQNQPTLPQLTVKSSNGALTCMSFPTIDIHNYNR